MIDPFKIIRKKKHFTKITTSSSNKNLQYFSPELPLKTSIDLLIGQINELILPVIVNNKEK